MMGELNDRIEAAPQGPPAYQQQNGPGYDGGMTRGAKSPAANLSNFPERLKNVAGIPKEIKNAYLLFLLGALRLVRSAAPSMSGHPSSASSLPSFSRPSWSGCRC